MVTHLPDRFDQSVRDESAIMAARGGLATARAAAGRASGRETLAIPGGRVGC